MTILDLILYVSLIGFYGCIAFSLNIKNSHLLKICVLLFVALQTFVSFVGYGMYIGFIDVESSFGLALSFGGIIIYGFAYIIVAIPFIVSRNEFKGWSKNLGWIALAGGICYCLILLFPLGMVGVVLFEISIIYLLFQGYYKSIEIEEPSSH
jgi:hypothetical protein